MNTHALHVLEFEAALEHVAGFAASDSGRRAVRGLAPLQEVSAIRAELTLVTEGVSLLGRDEGWAMSDFPDLAEPLERLRMPGYVWEAGTLRAGHDLLTASRATRRATTVNPGELPGIASLGSSLADLPASITELDRAVDEEGAVRDKASPELYRLRREIGGARSRIVQRLSEYASSLPSHLQVQDASVTIRDGRYVIPVRREGRGEVGGIVHGESQTGTTLFVEPPIGIELMNRLRELESAESREVHRILRELTDQLRPHAELMSSSLATLTVLDTIYARARYAVRVEGQTPDVVDPASGTLRIVAGRHPLLLARDGAVVPFDLELSEGERTLVISGPNTGGKTVLLKAIGLVSLMAQSGIVPPVAAGTRLPRFGEIFADIGDEQSIEASLSTFSAHLKNLRETLLHADSQSLVLVDEIGAGTDPAEGAALAQAILRELTQRSALTVATTHLGALKLLATGDPRFVNASLQFDAERLQPTYRLLKGVPGRSYGLAIARRLGMEEAILKEAEAFLPEGERDVARLLLALEAKEQRLDEASAELEAELVRTKALAEDLEVREAEMERRERDAERRAREQARDLLMKSRSEVEEAIQQVRASADEASLDEAARAARRRVEEAARQQRERIPEPAPISSSRRGQPPLHEGMRVRIESIGGTGTILELREGKAVVEAGGMRMRLPLDDLRALPPGDQAKPAARRGRPSGGRFDADLDARPEVDLRGLRVDELHLRLSRALDSALVAGLPSFRIIHGKGTGALRAEVEQVLRGDPRIASFRPGDRFEGGTGVTVAEFSQS